MTTVKVEQPLISQTADLQIKEAINHLCSLRKQKKYHEGWQYANNLIKKYPNHTEVMGFIVLLAKDLEEMNLAFGFALNKLHQYPNDFYLTYQLGMLYYYNHDFDKALLFVKKAAAMDSKNFLIGSNLAIIYFEHGDFDLAIATYQQQIDIKNPDEKLAFGKALALLAKKEYARGWETFEHRFLLKDPDCRPIKLSTPLWDGSADIHGKRLLVTWEQGYGDNIQFIRFMPLLKQKTQATIMHVCLPQLTRLFQFVPGIDLLTDHLPIPPHDYQIAIQSIPYLLRLHTDEQLLPMPYLHADPTLIHCWRQKINSHRIKIGLCWSGAKSYMHSTKRDLGLHHFLELFGDSRIQIYSLQKLISDDDAHILHAGNVANLGADFKDFADTAAVIALLDIVITVDTSVAHLAAALGKPTYVLIRYETEWRHPREQNVSPWYSAMRLFRQHRPGSWHECTEAVIKALHQFIDDFVPISIPAHLQELTVPMHNVEATSLQPISIRFPQPTGKVTEAEMLQINQLYLSNQFEASMKLAKACFERDSSCIGALVSIARAATSLNQESLAVSILLTRLKEDPNNPLTNHLLSSAYKMLRQYDKSLFYSEKSLKIEKNNPIYLETSAKNYYDIGKTGKSYKLYEIINNIQSSAETQINMSLSSLANRNYQQGWKLYERRFELDLFKKEYIQSDMPYWDGHTDIHGKHLILLWEQGIGDVIQFMRFIPLLKEKTQAHISFVCGPALVSLSEKILGVDAVYSKLPLPQHDYKIYLQSLPLLLEIFNEDQFLSTPYIKPNENIVKKWQKLICKQEKYNIGICWKGGKKYSYTNQRNTSIGYFLPLIQKKNYQLISLQKDLTKEEEDILSYTPIVNLDSQLTTLEETSAVISNLDLVISVDTAIAHLAGAVGKPVWTLIRYETEWRHPRDTNLSPWYPHMRLFRQTEPGNWDSVFKQVDDALTEFFTDKNKEIA